LRNGSDNVQIEILTSSRGSKPDLKPAYMRWRQQFGIKRPLEIRSVSDGSLHDRIIIVDRDKFFIVGQSFNALATKLPTYIAELNPEIKSMKIQAYLGVWASASLI
jgi:hypothetical protein